MFLRQLANGQQDASCDKLPGYVLGGRYTILRRDELASGVVSLIDHYRHKHKHKHHNYDHYFDYQRLDYDDDDHDCFIDPDPDPDRRLGKSRLLPGPGSSNPEWTINQQLLHDSCGLPGVL